MDVNINIIIGDIAAVAAEAIVNAANATLTTGGGVDGAIRRAAGEGDLQEELDEVKKMLPLGVLPEGEAVVTGAHGMTTCEHIIHTVAPQCNSKRPPTRTQEHQLRSCYLSVLSISEEDDIKSVAFPLLGTGAYNYPMKKGLFVAVQAILAHFESCKEGYSCFPSQYFAVDLETNRTLAVVNYERSCHFIGIQTFCPKLEIPPAKCNLYNRSECRPEYRPIETDNYIYERRLDDVTLLATTATEMLIQVDGELITPKTIKIEHPTFAQIIPQNATVYLDGQKVYGTKGLQATVSRPQYTDVDSAHAFLEKFQFNNNTQLFELKTSDTDKKLEEHSNLHSSYEEKFKNIGLFQTLSLCGSAIVAFFTILIMVYGGLYFYGNVKKMIKNMNEKQNSANAIKEFERPHKDARRLFTVDE